MKQWGMTFIKIFVAIALILWMASQGFLNFAEIFRSMTFSSALTAGLILFTMILFNHWRWVLLLAGERLSSGFWNTMPLTFIGLFFNYAMPGGVGGDVVKGYYLVKGKSQGKLDAVLTIFMDRLIGLWAMSFLALFGFFLNWELTLSSSQLLFMMYAVLLLFLCFVFLMAFSFAMNPAQFHRVFSFFQRLPKGEYLFRLYDLFHSYSRRPKLVAVAFVLSLAAQLLAVFFMWFVGRQFEPNLSFLICLFAIPIGFMAMALPIAPAGIGVGQAALLFLFNAALGKTSDIGPNTMTVYQIFLFAWSLIGAYYYVRKGAVRGEVPSVG